MNNDINSNIRVLESKKKKNPGKTSLILALSSLGTHILGAIIDGFFVFILVFAFFIIAESSMVANDSLFGGVFYLFLIGTYLIVKGILNIAKTGLPIAALITGIVGLAKDKKDKKALCGLIISAVIILLSIIGKILLLLIGLSSGVFSPTYYIN